MKHLLPLVTPLTNLNGNNPHDLVHQLRDVMDAMNKTIDVMAKASDIHHGRNFQTLDDHQIKAQMARDAWWDRITTMNEIRDEILQMAVEIQKQIRPRP
jgi:hypothetical protein